MADRQFPYEYGSDLHNLWGWGARIDARLAGEHPVNKYDWMLFRPDRSATNAMMRFSVKYAQIIALINTAQTFVERRYKLFRKKETEANRDALADAMGVLKERIWAAAETIAKHEPPRGDKPEARLTPKQQKALDYIRQHPGRKAILIARHLEITVEGFRSRYVPALKAVGVTNEKDGEGYFPPGYRRK